MAGIRRVSGATALFLRPARSLRSRGGLAFHIAESQAYIDGNKRTGAAAALTFLEMNGVRTHAEPDALEQAMIGIAKHEMTKADLAQRFRELFPS